MLRLCLILAVLLFPDPVRGADDSFARTAPADAGFSEEGLEDLTRYLESQGSSAMLMVRHGKVFYEWGDTHKPLLVHSIRKALLNALFGIYVERGVIDLDASLAELGVQDSPHALTAGEQQATLRHLLKSRSGVYLPAAAVADRMLVDQPERGRYAPDEHYYYNNWDFNAAGGVFEQLTGVPIHEAFLTEIAQPLGMKHYRGRHAVLEEPSEGAAIPDADFFYQYERDKSRFPAYHFRLSAHDLALYGQLFVGNGTWNGKPILTEEWIEESARAWSMTSPEYDLAYGMLWGVVVNDEAGARNDMFHTGNGVHMLGIYPDQGLVFVHRVNTEADFDFTGDALYGVINRVFAARIREENP